MTPLHFEHSECEHAGDLSDFGPNPKTIAARRGAGDHNWHASSFAYTGNSLDELGSGANCSDFLDCLEVPTRDTGDFRHSRLLHGVRGSVLPFCVGGGNELTARWYGDYL